MRTTRRRPQGTGKMNKDLFGNIVDVFVTAKEKYGIYPITVWDCNLSDPYLQQLKKEIGDYGQARSQGGQVFFAGSFRKVGTSDLYTNKGFCAFNPVVAQLSLNCYESDSGLIFYPLALSEHQMISFQQ